MNLIEYLTSLANSIRKAKGSEEKIKAENFVNEIKNLEVETYNITNTIEKTFETITIPEDIEILSPRMLNGAKNLKELDLSNSKVRLIENNSLENCTSLSIVKFPKNLEIIESRGFSNSGITNLYLADTVITNIEARGFEDCSSLEKITAPDTLEYIGVYGFLNCANLKSIDLSNTKITLISNGTFNDCLVLDEIKLPNALTYIGEYAFQGTGIKDLDLSNTKLESIDVFAFNSCYPNFTKITLPNTVKKIERYVFNECYRLDTINLPQSLESIAYNTFNACGRLLNIVLEDGFNCNGLNISSTTRAEFTVEKIINNVLNPLKDRTGESTYTLSIGANLNKLTPEEIAIATDKNWTLA